MIDGRTRLAGLIGWPVSHSLSPAMHNAAFEALGLNWAYVPLRVPPEHLAAALAGLPALGFVGANVTVPHKEAVLPYLHHASAEVRVLGAANTLAVRDLGGEAGRPVLIGLNTDHAGLILTLRDEGVELAGCRALVLGAGGAARAVVYGLMGAGAASIAVLNRSPARAEALTAGLAAVNRETLLIAGPLTPTALGEHARTATLLINASAVGMEPVAEASPWPAGLPLPAHLAVLDLVYQPRHTRLLAQAEEAGARPISGLGMLVYQAAQAFEIWTGEKAPIEVMRRACEWRQMP